MNEPMTMKDVIEQLEGLRRHCQEFSEKGDPTKVWKDDVAAFDATLPILRELFRQGIENAEALTDLFFDYNAAATTNETLYKKFLTGTPAIRVREGLWLCPNCKKRTGFNHSHCHWCGKKLAWKGESNGRGKR